jgi:hypothetical protein
MMAVVTRDPQMADRVQRATHAVRELERFAYRLVSEAVETDAVVQAQTILRLTVGLRRKLDALRREE